MTTHEVYIRLYDGDGMVAGVSGKIKRKQQMLDSIPNKRQMYSFSMERKYSIKSGTRKFNFSI